MTVRRSYHRLSSSAIAVALTLILGFGAINSQNNLLFLAFALALGAFGASGFLSARMVSGLSAARELPEWGAVGAPLTIGYTIHNSNRRLAAFALRLSEVDAPIFRAPSASTDPAPARAPTWMTLMPPPRAALAHVAPSRRGERGRAAGGVRVYATIIPTHRGAARFVGVRLISSFPLGLFTKSISFKAPRTILILPRVVRLRRDATAELVARANTGERCAPSRGPGDEFFGLRDYSPGDSPRTIAWRASARLGALVVREHTAPRAGSLLVILNLNRGGAEPLPDDQIEDAITLAASLLADAGVRAMDAGLAVPASRILIPPGAGLRHRLDLLSALASIDTEAIPDPHRSLASAPPDEEDEAAQAQCAPGALRIVVHAGPVDPTVGPPGARHLSSADLARLAADPAPSSSPAPSPSPAPDLPEPSA